MQRELISIPKMLLYALVTILVYVIQTSVFGAHPLFGYHVDLLPAAVTAAALLDGPVEGAVVGLLAGVLYDVGLVGMDGIYPIYFMLYGLLGGLFSRTALAGGFLSMVLMNAFEMLLLGMLRYFVQLMREARPSCSCCIRRSAERSSRACCALSSICPCGASAAHFRGTTGGYKGATPWKINNNCCTGLPRCSSCCCCACACHAT